MFLYQFTMFVGGMVEFHYRAKVLIIIKLFIKICFFNPKEPK